MDTDYGIDTAGVGERATLPWLDGFWRYEHDTLAPVPVPLMAGVTRRAREALDRASHVRSRLIEEWDLWRFQAEAQIC